jgi:hypothetical protein
LCEELSGIYDKDIVMELYKYATTQPHSFLNVKLDAKVRRDVFWLRFETRLVPKESEDER